MLSVYPSGIWKVGLLIIWKFSEKPEVARVMTCLTATSCFPQFGDVPEVVELLPFELLANNAMNHSAPEL